MKTEEAKPTIALPPLLAPYRALLGPGLDEYFKSLAERPAQHPPVELIFHAWLMVAQKSMEALAAWQNLGIAMTVGVLPEPRE